MEYEISSKDCEVRSLEDGVQKGGYKELSTKYCVRKKGFSRQVEMCQYVGYKIILYQAKYETEKLIHEKRGL